MRGDHDDLGQHDDHDLARQHDHDVPAPRHGQTRCWNASGIEVPCGGTGQDGDVRAGFRLPTRTTGWHDHRPEYRTRVGESSPTTRASTTRTRPYSWADAFALKIASPETRPRALRGTATGGCRTREMLQSLVDFGSMELAVSPAFNTNCTPGCTVLTCSCTVGSSYWSVVDVRRFADLRMVRELRRRLPRVPHQGESATTSLRCGVAPDVDFMDLGAPLSRLRIAGVMRHLRRHCGDPWRAPPRAAGPRKAAVPESPSRDPVRKPRPARVPGAASACARTIRLRNNAPPGLATHKSAGALLAHEQGEASKGRRTDGQAVVDVP